MNGKEKRCVFFVALAVFLCAWCFTSWKLALGLAGVEAAIQSVITLFRNAKHDRERRRDMADKLNKLQTVRFDGNNLCVGQCLIPAEEITSAESVHDNKTNEEVAITAVLKNKLKVIIYRPFIHQSACEFLKERMTHPVKGQMHSEDFIKEGRGAYEQYLALQKTVEVVLCVANDAIKTFIQNVQYRVVSEIDDDRCHDVLSLSSEWMNSYLGLKFWEHLTYNCDLYYYRDDKAREIAERCRVVLNRGNAWQLYKIGLDDKKCQSLQAENAREILEVIRMRAFLLAKMNNGDPVGSYQLYSYFSENRSAENVKDRLMLMRGLGVVKMASERRVIVCTDNPRVEGTMEQRASGVLIATASDIHAYNQQDDLPVNEKLEFLPSGHPVTNCTYIQHPTRKNCYIESSSYHLTILERKFVELQSVMRGVGAVTMTVEAGEIAESSSSYGKKRANSLGGKYKGVGGSVRNSSSADGTSFESVMYKLSMKGQWEPISHRQLPDNLEFYEGEGQWKEIADAALKGQSPEVRVRLEIKRESETSCKTFKEAMVSVSCLITDFDASQSDEFEEKSRQMSSMCWDYHVVFGASTQRKPEDMSAANKASDGTQLSDGQRAEALILRMVRQFLTESGTITEENKKEIGGIASEFGVQKLRVLELIQCAKEQSSSPVQSIEMK